MDHDETLSNVAQKPQNVLIKFIINLAWKIVTLNHIK